MKHALRLAAFFILAPGVALAQNCPAIGTSIQPVSRDIAFSIPKTVSTKKDEFETTAAYEARLKQLFAPTESFWIVDHHLAANALPYNADAGRFEIPYNSLAVDLNFYEDSELTAFERAGLNFGQYNKILDLGANEEEKSRRRMRDSSGAAFEAAVVESVSFRVFDKTVDLKSDKHVWVPDFTTTHEEVLDNGSSYTQTKKYVAIEMDPSTARTMKSQITGAIRLKPKSPYRVDIDPIPSSLPPSSDFPYIWTNTYKVLVAGILCYAFLDANGTIINTVDVTP